MGRPSKPLITKERAAKVALDIIDKEGLSALSLHEVARQLNVKAPSLYYHFKNKSELLSAVAKAVLSDPLPAKVKRRHEDWREGMVALCVWARKSLMKHPNAAPLLLEIYPERIMLGTYEFWISRYENTNLEDKMIISEGLEKLTFGSALLGAMSRAQGIEAFPSNLDPKRYPNLVAAIRANKRSESKIFEEAVRRFLSSF